MIKLTDSEIWAINILQNAIRRAQQELQLEAKYDAVFNVKTGQLDPKDAKKDENEDVIGGEIAQGNAEGDKVPQASC